MSWLILIFSGVFEAVWALALAASQGFRKPKPTALFFGSLMLSMVGLAWAMRDLPTGTAYAVWVGIGASITVIWSLMRREETATVMRIALLLVLIGSVVGLKVVS